MNQFEISHFACFKFSHQTIIFIEPHHLKKKKIQIEMEQILTSIAERGFVVLPSYLSANDLASLRKDCHRVTTTSTAHLRGDCIHEPVSTTELQFTPLLRHSIQQYSSRRSQNNHNNDHHNDSKASNNVVELLLGYSNSGKQLHEILHWILGDQLYVLNEQYIVKPGVFSSSKRNNAKKEDQDQDDSGLRSRKRQKRTAKPIVSTAFKWHRDADYLRLVGCTPEPSISVWCCLDDVSVVNGTLTFAPLDEPNERIVITEKAGTIVLISSEVLHKSSENTSDKSRRIWMPQYSSSQQYWPKDIGKDNELAALALKCGQEEVIAEGGRTCP